MRSKQEALEIVVDTWTTIAGSKPAGLEIIFSDTDELDSPRVKLERFGDNKSLQAIEFPLRIWRDASEAILRVSVALEMANYFLDERTPLEEAMRNEIAQATTSQEVELIRLKYERDLYIIDVQLARKLEGDEGIYHWFVKANYNPRWIVDFFHLLKDETPNRIKPAGRIRPRLCGLNIRLLHILYLINGFQREAEQLREQQSDLSQAILADFTSTNS